MFSPKAEPTTKCFRFSTENAENEILGLFTITVNPYFRDSYFRDFLM